MSVLEKFALLSLDNERGKFYSDTYIYKDFSIAGAILMDLSLKKRINVKKRIVFITDQSPTGDEILDFFLNMLKNSKKPRKLSYWITKFSSRARRLAKPLFHEYVSNGRLLVERVPFIWIFNKKRYHLAHSEEQDTIMRGLKQLIHGVVEETDEYIYLLSLIYNCYLYNQLFDRKYRRVVKKRVKTLISAEEIGKAVYYAISAAQSASVAATTGAI